MLSVLVKDCFCCEEQSLSDTTLRWRCRVSWNTTSVSIMSDYSNISSRSSSAEPRRCRCRMLMTSLSICHSLSNTEAKTSNSLESETQSYNLSQRRHIRPRRWKWEISEDWNKVALKYLNFPAEGLYSPKDKIYSGFGRSGLKGTQNKINKRNFKIKVWLNALYCH